MPNIISLLIIIIALLAGVKSDYVSNPLLSFGLLIVLAYLFANMMRFFRLPGFTGYILAGILAGPNGLGFFHDNFPDSMSLIEGLCIMLIVSNAAGFMLKGKSPALFSKYFFSGVLSSLGTMLLTIGFLAPVSMPLHVKIILGLFAATFSPLMTFAYTGHDESPGNFTETAFGGFACAIILWGILMPILGQPLPGRIKLVFMPAVIGVTSLLTGFVWAFITEKLLYRKTPGMRYFFPLVVMFLIYPCCREIGLDYLFVAIGVGVYYGIISEKTENITVRTELPALIVFCILGTKLPVIDALLLGNAGWKIVTLLTLVIVFSRIITLKLSMRLFTAKTGPPTLELIHLIPYGPLSVLILMRFLPGFSSVPGWEFDKFRVLSICTTSIILTIIFTSVIQLITDILKSKKQANTL